MEHSSLAETPAAMPPSNQLSNFVDPPSQQGAMIGVCTLMMVLTLFFVTIRIYSSFHVTRTPGMEDYTCLLSMIFSFAYIGFVLDLSYVARHMWDIPQAWFTENYWKVRFAQNTIQAFAFFTSRMPIFLLYLRLFGRNQILRVTVYFGIAAAFAIYMSEIPLITYFCAPRIGGSWSSMTVFANCKKLGWYAVAQGSGNIAMDLYIFVLPLWTIFGLHLPLEKRLGVFAIFAVGFLAVIASAISLYFRYQLSFGPDVNWNEGAYIITATVEINIAIICGSIPACSSFVKHVFKDKSLFDSVRSLFYRQSLFSTARSQSKKRNSSYNSTYATSGEHSGRSRTPIAQDENNYVELRESRAKIESNHGFNSTSDTRNQQGGIRKTVEVEIV